MSVVDDIPFRAGAVIVGAGRSQRLGKDKIFLPLGGKPLLAWSVDVCHSCNLVDQIVIVLNEDNIISGRRLASERGWSKVIDICLGGSRRQDSVREGLNKLRGCDWVIIHDGARPFLSTDLIINGLKAAQETGAAVAAVPVKDTIKLSDANFMVKRTFNREGLWLVQTPQVFRSDIINKAHMEISEDVTDDASMVEKMGYQVKIYMGSYENMKVTSVEDLALAEMIARNRQTDANRNRL